MRVYARHFDPLTEEALWRTKVVDLMARVDVVVMRAGGTSSVLWELQQVLDRVEPTRFLLYVDMPARDYASLRADLVRRLCIGGQPSFRLRLPEVEELARDGGVLGFVIFSEDWSPVALPMRRPWILGSPFRRFFAPFRAA